MRNLILFFEVDFIKVFDTLLAVHAFFGISVGEY